MNTLSKFKYDVAMIVSILFILGLIHPLGPSTVLADELDKSVLDSFKMKDGKMSTPNENNSSENNPKETGEMNVDMDEQSLFGMFFQLFLALVVVIAMIYALIRFIGKRSQSYQTNRMLQNIGGVHIASNRSIQLVRVGNRVLVVGVGETIALLKEIDNKEEVQQILADYEIQEGHQQVSLLFSWVKENVQKVNQKQTQNLNFKGLLERQLNDVKDSQKQAHAAIKEREQ